MAITLVSPQLRASPLTAASFSRAKRKSERVRVVGNLGHLAEVVKKDVAFLKKGFKRGVEWANDTFRVGKVKNETLWLRNSEDPVTGPESDARDWPQPHYPQLSGMDLFMADLKALEAYIGYYYYLSKNDVFRVGKVKKTVNEALWLRNLEDPNGLELEAQAWPQPHYPQLSGVDLFMADLKALEAYIGYYYYLSKIWSKPLPEVYDPEAVAEYFNCRPHLVALRLIEVFISFTVAAVKIRASGIKRSIGPMLDENINGSTSQYNFGVVLKETMLSLGPTFIKVGQSLSTRPDIIGPEICQALSGLHDQIPPFPRDVAMKIIHEELGSPAETFFSYISHEPVAAASFGQVYRGRTHEGYDVAVKVQRPDMRHVVVRDVYILRLGLGIVRKVAKRKSDIRVYADELGKGLLGELDYTLEAANSFKFLEAHSRFSFMRIPKVFEHLSQKRVLTMEWMVGESPTELIALSTGNPINGSAQSDKQIIDAKRRLLDLVNKGVEATLVQLLETGLLHADPHPGNLRCLSSGQIGFLDFGLLCQMQKKHQIAMLASIVHIVNGDWSSLVQALTEMDIIRPGTNVRRVTMDLENTLEEVELKDGIPDIKFSRVLGNIWSLALKYQFRMPPYYTLVLRSLASFEGLALAADQKFKTFEAAYPYVVQKLLTENTVPTRKILHSVVFNKKKEFQWQRLALFLKVGTTRKRIARTLISGSENYDDHFSHKPDGNVNVVNLVLKLLTSKDGVVLRRLLMTVDGASLIRAMVSKEARYIRQQFCQTIAEVLYQWMQGVFGQSSAVTRNNYKMRISGDSGNKEFLQSSKLVSPTQDYQSIVGDRRLKVIFFKVLGSARSDPILMLRFCWASFVMFMMASALACHRIVVSLSETYLSQLSLSPKRYVISA